MSTTIDPMSAYYAALYAQNMDTALMYESDNNKVTALAQVQESTFEMQQATTDRELQQASDLELGIETLDTNLQTSQMDYIQQMSAEEDRHVEVMAAGGAEALAAIESTYSLSSDLPAPTSTDTSSDGADASSDSSLYGF